MQNPFRVFSHGDSRRFRLNLNDTILIVSIGGDFLLFLLGMHLAFCLRFKSPLTAWIPPLDFVEGSYNRFQLFGPVLFSLLAIAGGTYRQDSHFNFHWIYWHILRPMFFWAVSFVLLAFLFHVQPAISRAYIAFVIVLCTLFLILWHRALHYFFGTGPVAKLLRQRILMVGWNQEAARVFQVLNEDPQSGFEIVGCLPSAHSRYKEEPPKDVIRLGDYNEIAEFIEACQVDIVLVADLDPNTREMIALSELCARQMVQFKVIPSFFQIFISGLRLERVGNIPVLGVGRLAVNTFLNRVAKRALDIVGSVVGLILSAPLVAVFGAIVYIESPGPIFYSQIRTGRDGMLFRIYKIRSMRLDAEKHAVGWTTQNDTRRLRIGAFMRKYNIDEVPQFWNVFRGEMSLVGPRPERPEWIAKFKDEYQFYNARHNIKPGMTGLAQIQGLRGDDNLKDRLRADLYYIEHWSLLLDCYVMLMTFFRVKNAY